MKRWVCIILLFLLAISFTSKANEQPLSKNAPYNVGALSDFILSQWSIAQFGLTVESEHLLKEAIKKDPGSWYLKYILAEYYLLSGAFIRSQQILEMLKAKHKRNVEVRLLLAKTYTLLSDYDAAQSVYEAIVRMAPKNEEAMFHLSLVYAAKQEFNNAMRMLKRLEKFAEHISLVFLYQARIHLELGDEERAIHALEEAINHQVEHPEVWLLMAILKEGRGELDTAITYYEEYSQMRPEDNDVVKKLVDLYITKSDFEKALPILHELLRLEPDNYKIALKIALIDIEYNRLEEAKSILENIVRMNPEEEVAFYYLGVVCQMKQDLSCSYQAYENITKESPYYVEAVLQRAFIFIGLKQYNRAIKVINESKATGIYDENHVMVLSAAYELKEDLHTAAKVLTEYLKTDDENTRVMYAIASVLYKNSKQEKAVKTVRNILTIDPNHVQGLNFLGYHLLTKEKLPTEAYTLLKRAMDLSPDDPYVLDSWGWYWVKTGNHLKGAAFLEKAYLFKPDDVTILEHLLVALIEIGNLEKARYFLDVGQTYSAAFTHEERKKLENLALRMKEKARALASE